MWRPVVAATILSGILCPGLAGQTPAEQQTPTIRTTTREVILDVIVRDKHHHAVADLRPDEIEVFEDGAKQKINAFRDVQGSEQLLTEEAVAKSSSGTPTTKKPGATALPELNFVSIVLAQIAPLNLEFAREAVQDFLKSQTLPNTYVTIYQMDRSLHVVQPYTADQAVLLKAADAVMKGMNRGGQIRSSVEVASALSSSVDAAAANMMAQPNLSPAQAQAIQETVLHPIPQIVTDPLWARNAGSQDASLALGSALMTQARLATGLRVSESLSNGMDSFDALRELVRVQSTLPGRKVVLYLADGLTLPMNRRDVVDGVISFANRMEVAFYTVDTRGLSTENPLMQSITDQQRAAAESSANNVSPRIGHHEDDDIQLSTSSDKQLAMVELAEATGGFAVTNTNEIALPMQRVMEDIRTHYELAYTPTDSNYDGHFRKIEVRISRPHVTVQTRSGYFALPDNGEPVKPFETRALHALETRPAAADFPYQTALLRFRPKADAVESEMAFDIPISGLRVVMDPKDGNGHIRVSVTALIHDTGGQVIGKISRDLERNVSKEELPHLGDQRILYAEPIELAGGHYSIDTAVTDELADKTAVKKISAFVDSGKPFGVSSLQLVRGVRPLAGPRDSRDPFQTESGRVVPTLAESMPAGQPLGLYFVVYPTPTAEAEPTVTLQLFKDGREVGVKSLTPPQPQEDGSVPMLLQITPDPGQCDVVITAHQGAMKSEAMLSVNIKPSGTPNAN